MKQAMRDAFWDTIYELAKKDESIVIVSADFGAPSLDKFRKDYPQRYINVGISEQNAILVATGLALAGKKPIVYAISQFITLRCIEQIRLYPCGMNLPIMILGVGAGACYWESGYTHHCLEQLSMMRTLPNLNIVNCSDTEMAKKSAEIISNIKCATYVQLDREIISEIHPQEVEIDKGYSIVDQYDECVVVATGNMVKEAIEIKSQSNMNYGIIDLFKLPVNVEQFIDDLKGVKKILTMEENVLEGGMGSYLLEILSDHKVNSIEVQRIGIKDHNSLGYHASYDYAGREKIRYNYGMGREQIIEQINEFLGDKK